MSHSCSTLPPWASLWVLGDSAPVAAQTHQPGAPRAKLPQEGSTGLWARAVTHGSEPEDTHLYRAKGTAGCAWAHHLGASVCSRPRCLGAQCPACARWEDWVSGGTPPPLLGRGGSVASAFPPPAPASVSPPGKRPGHEQAVCRMVRCGQGDRDRRREAGGFSLPTSEFSFPRGKYMCT